MDLERFITVFIFVSRAVCRCDGKKVTYARKGDPKSRNGGMAEWRKMTPNPKTRNGGK